MTETWRSAGVFFGLTQKSLCGWCDASGTWLFFLFRRKTSEKVRYLWRCVNEQHRQGENQRWWSFIRTQHINYRKYTCCEPSSYISCTSHWPFPFPLKHSVLCHLFLLVSHLVSCVHLWLQGCLLYHCKERTENYELSQTWLNQVLYV